jgi:outer membrane protein TolC
MWIPITMFALTVLLTGCMTRQLTSDIDKYVKAAGPETPPETMPAMPSPEEELKGLSGDRILDGYVNLALLRNPAVNAAKGRWLAARARAVSESYPEDPTATYGRFVKEFDQRRNASFMQQIPTPPKLHLRGRAASEEAAAMEQEYMAVALDVATNVKTTFHELFYIKRAIDVTNENREILKNVITIAQAQLRAGKATGQDVLKAQVELDKTDSDLLMLQQQWETMRADFNALRYLPPSAEVTMPEKVEISETVPDPEALYPEALKRRPEILQANAAVRQSDVILSLARLKRLPDLTLGIDWMQMLAMPANSTHSALDLSFGFNLPIWLNKLKAQEYESRALKAAAIWQRDSVVSNALSQIKSTHYKYITAKKLEALYAESLVPHAEQARELAETGYKASKVGVLDLLDSQRTLLMFRLAQLRATTDRYQRLAELERAVGKSLTAGATSPDKTSGEGK